MVEYLSGNRIQGSSTLSSAPPQTSWKELGRATLSSGTSDSITTPTFGAKENLMILVHTIPDGQVTANYRFNADSGSNYARRQSSNGASDGTATSQDHLLAGHGASGETTLVTSHIINKSNKEKLVTTQIMAAVAGAGNAPDRRELVGKWANTSAQITSVTLYNNDSGSFNAGTEVVVLGCDNDEADSGTNFWQELASVTRTDNGSTLESGNFATKKYLMVEACTIPANNGFKGRLEFGHSNGTMDTGSNYADRYEQDGGADSTNASNPYIYAYTNHDDNIQHLRMFIVNKSAQEKLVLWWASSGGSTTGAGNAPQRRNGVAKWVNTSYQMTNIRLNSQIAGGDAASGSFIKVYGAD